MSNNIIQSLRNNELKYKNRIYECAFMVLVIKALLAYSELIGPTLSRLALDVGNFIFLILILYKVIFLQKYSTKQVIFILILGLITLYSDYTLSMFMFVQDFFLLIATQDVDFSGLIRKVYKLEAAVIVFHLAVYGFLWKFNRSILNFSYRFKDGEFKTRHRFLLSHSNLASMLVLWTILGFLYSEYDHLNKKKIIGAWLAYFCIYLLTDSNSGLIILTAVVALLLLKEIFNELIEKIVSFLAKYLFIVLAIVFNFLMVIYKSTSGIAREIWLVINNFFTGRLIYGVYAYDKYGITLFGRMISNKKDYWEGMWIDAVPSDNTYMWFAVGYGVIYLFIISFMFWKYSKYANFIEKIMIIAYSLYTMMELYVTYIYFDFSIIILMAYIWNRRSEQKNLIGENNGSESTS